MVISGAGTLGLGMITYARMKNPAKLIVLDMQDNRLEKAKEFGADIVMNPSKENVVERVKEMTDGYGCDIYIEATDILRAYSRDSTWCASSEDSWSLAYLPRKRVSTGL